MIELKSEKQENAVCTEAFHQSRVKRRGTWSDLPARAARQCWVLLQSARCVGMARANCNVSTFANAHECRR
jgi:hypothetical protein